MGLFQCSFVSYTLDRMLEVSVILPTALPGEGRRHKPEAPYPVLYLLHGYMGNSTVWHRFTSLERYAEERNIAVVTLSGENKFYANHPGDDRFYDFLAQELPDFVCGLFPISTRREDTFIAGLSMGGFGTLLHALSRPEAFCAFGAFSAGIRETGVDQPADAVCTDTRPDLFLLLARYADRMDQLPKAYLSCGMKDGLYAINQRLRDQFRAQGGEVYWDEMPQYAHEWGFWDIQLEKFLDWIPRTDAYVGAPARHV